MAPINPKHVIMRMLVWNMRWMTRYVGFIARPIVRVYGENEIIACGLREEDGSTSIIYTPIPGHRNHRARMRERIGGGKALWRAAAFEPQNNFSGSAVKRITLPGAQNGFVYTMAGENARGRVLSSPAILVKPDTVSDPEMLLIEPSADGSVLFSWPRGEAHDPMIYFLAIEGADGMSRAAIYTREHTWRYPLIKTASYSVGPDPAPRLVPGESLTASLALVDYDGWVTHLARRTCGMPRTHLKNNPTMKTQHQLGYCGRFRTAAASNGSGSSYRRYASPCAAMPRSRGSGLATPLFLN